jgi:hypothetical protein
MTEAEWQTSTDPLTMYQLLHESTLVKTRWQGWMPARTRRISARKETLFRCAVCEPLLEIVQSDPARHLLEMRRREQFLPETTAVVGDMLGGFIRRVLEESRSSHPAGQQEAWEVLTVLTGGIVEANWDWLHSTAHSWAVFKSPDGDLWQRGKIMEAERQRQAHLLREFVGNPFHAPGLPERWKTWDGGLVLGMARRIDLNEDFAGLPVLGDALEDAGCTDADILAHCRHPGPHLRGCWVLDLLLGRE